MHSLTLISIGAYTPQSLTLGVLDAMKNAERLILRTGDHPVARYLTKQGVVYETLDALYDTAEDFDQFNEQAAKHVLSACEQADAVYAVSSLIGDTTVEKLIQQKPDNLTIQAAPGVEPSQSVLCALLCQGAPGVTSGALRLITATAFLQQRVTPKEPLLLTELHSAACASECKLRLGSLMPDEWTIYLVKGDLTPKAIPLYELDRQKQYDHLTSAYIPAAPMEARTRFDMDDLIAVMARLRGVGGCPWDREQTHESLLPSLLEEAWEFIDAAKNGEIDHMYDELGDVLLQVVFHAQVAKEHGDFDIDDVTSAICQKMIERHTHIFGNVKAETSEDVLNNWEAIKRQQRGIQTHTQAMRGVSTGLSTLLRAYKVQHKAAKVKFDFPSASAALDKVTQEADEVRQNLSQQQDPTEELGDLLFSIVNVCRLLDVNPDIALHFATEKFITRFAGMEESIKKSGKCFEYLTLSEMDVYWNIEKQSETGRDNHPTVS